MNDLFLFLLLASIIGLAVGLVRPSIVRIASRKKVLGIFGGAIVVSMILFGVTSPVKQSEEQAQPNQKQAAEQKTPEQPVQQAPTVSKTLEEKVADAVNGTLGSKTNTSKPRVVGVEIDKYNASMLSDYGYKAGDFKVGLLIKINSDENLTTNLQKGTMYHEAAKIAQAIFPLDASIGDIIIWSQLPVQDRYGNTKDDTAIVFSMARPLFEKINWSDYDYHELPTLLKSENRTDDRNNYFEKINFN